MGPVRTGVRVHDLFSHGIRRLRDSHMDVATHFRTFVRFLLLLVWEKW